MTEESILIAKYDVSSLKTRRDAYLKLEFADMASHLLRTPLSFIQAAIDLLMSLDLSAEEQRATLDKMREQNNRLTVFTNELLKILRLETEEIRVCIKQVELLSLIERVLELVEYENPCHLLNLAAFDALPAVAADPIKTELILLNLLLGAVRRCPNGGRITIEPTACKSEVTISILDDGEFIPAKWLDKVFEQFYPVDGENGKMPSTYHLGYYTTRRLIELQGGRIWAESRPGRGSRFSFSLPVWETSG